MTSVVSLAVIFFFFLAVCCFLHKWPYVSLWYASHALEEV